MEKIEFISARVSIAFLSLFGGYMFLAVLPGFFGGVSVGSFEFNGKLGYIVAIAQIIGIGGIWSGVGTRKWLSLILNIAGICLAILYLAALSTPHIN